MDAAVALYDWSQSVEVLYRQDSDRLWRVVCVFAGDCNEDAEAPIVYQEDQGGALVVNCEVATRWHRLSLEVTERWSYEFHGSLLAHWGFRLLDLKPSDRAVPLGL